MIKERMIRVIKTLVSDKRITYDGTQMQSHWIHNQFGLVGDAVVAFIGQVKVDLDKMIDLIDVSRKESIYSPLMLNFLIEHFNPNLELAIYRQWLFMTLIKEELSQFEVNVYRLGDDLYFNKAKLSVSVATVSNVSSLIHIGLNIETEGTPIKTVGLSELGISDINSFADTIMLKYRRELEHIHEARCKVRGV
jgi:hypothetical protein